MRATNSMTAISGECCLADKIKYITGGTLPPDAAVYQERAADSELLSLCLDGQFAYVLTSRQMGKSSLMAAHRPEVARTRHSHRHHRPDQHRHARDQRRTMVFGRPGADRAVLLARNRRVRLVARQCRAVIGAAVQQLYNRRIVERNFRKNCYLRR